MRYGCIGERLGHSFSAIIHGFLGDEDYRLTELSEDMLAKDEWGNDILKLLPIRDYPLFLIFEN